MLLLLRTIISVLVLTVVLCQISSVACLPCTFSRRITAASSAIVSSAQRSLGEQHTQSGTYTHSNSKSSSSNSKLSMSEKPVIEAVIFDLDGTLLDTESLSTESILMAVRPFGVQTFDFELKKRVLGLKDHDWSRVVIEALGLQGKLTAEELVEQWEMNMYEMLKQVQKMPGAGDLTKGLHEKGIPMAIATSSTYEQVQHRSTLSACLLLPMPSCFNNCVNHLNLFLLVHAGPAQTQKPQRYVRSDEGYSVWK